MFMLWRRLQCEGSLNKQMFTASFKYCRSGKPFNVLKSVNTENKYLFGRLLETQKQRRRTTRKQIQNTEGEGITNTENGISHSKEKPGLEAVKSSCIGKKNKSSSLKLPAKDNTETKEVPFSSVATDAKSSDRIDENCNNMKAKTSLNIEHTDRNGMGHNKPPKKLTKKKLKTQSDNLNLVENLHDGKETPDEILMKRCIFKPTLLINETNYPLDSEAWPAVADEAQSKPVANFGFNDPHTKDYVTYPSVSKIIEETMSTKSRTILNRWKENMIKELGQEGFTEYNAAAKERGSQFHEAVRDAVLGRGATGGDSPSHSRVTRNALHSLAWLLRHISRPVAVESVTAHPTLRYKGVPDCVATFRDIPVVVDWKLSDKPKKDLKDTYDAPVQVTAYIGALNHDPNYAWTVSHGLLAVAYTSGDPCDVFLLAPQHCRIYWRHWLARLDRFKARSHLHLDHHIDERDLTLD